MPIDWTMEAGRAEVLALLREDAASDKIAEKRI